MINRTQEILERSIFTLIQDNLVAEGYWPSYNSNTYPNTQAGISAWNAAIASIVATKNFAVEPYGYSSPVSKGIKLVPRIVIITRRFDPGDIGNPVDMQVIQNPDNPDTYQGIIRPQESLHLQIEVHIIVNTADQERTATSMVYNALGSKSFIPYYNKPGLFFLRQFNFYDLPDSTEGIIEKVYCYEVRDIYIQNDTIPISNVPLIEQITLEVEVEESIESTSVYNTSTNPAPMPRIGNVTIGVYDSPASMDPNNPSTYFQLRNGIKIASQYPSGNNFTIPYMVGKYVYPDTFQINYKPVGPGFTYTPSNAQLDNTPDNGFFNGDTITFLYEDLF